MLTRVFEGFYFSTRPQLKSKEMKGLITVCEIREERKTNEDD